MYVVYFIIFYFGVHDKQPLLLYLICDYCIQPRVLLLVQRILFQFQFWIHLVQILIVEFCIWANRSFVTSARPMNQNFDFVFGSILDYLVANVFFSFHFRIFSSWKCCDWRKACTMNFLKCSFLDCEYFSPVPWLFCGGCLVISNNAYLQW